MSLENQVVESKIMVKSQKIVHSDCQKKTLKQAC